MKLEWKLAHREGQWIDVGENFTLRFLATNRAFGWDLPKGRVYNDKPEIVFLKPKVPVHGTVHAKPVDGEGWHDLNHVDLTPGETGRADVKFEALEGLDFVRSQYLVEAVATAHAVADLDLKRFFAIRSSWQTIHQNIVGPIS